MGRKPAGAGIVDQLPGSEFAKQRLRVILDSIQDDAVIEEACAELGLERSRFHELRREGLIAILGKLEPRPAGRPRAQKEDAELARLTAEIQELRAKLRLAEVRLELNEMLPIRSKKTAR
jgi:hypothetical protein